MADGFRFAPNPVSPQKSPGSRLDCRSSVKHPAVVDDEEVAGRQPERQGIESTQSLSELRKSASGLTLEVFRGKPGRVVEANNAIEALDHGAAPGVAVEDAVLWELEFEQSTLQMLGQSIEGTPCLNEARGSSLRCRSNTEPRDEISAVVVGMEVERLGRRHQ